MPQYDELSVERPPKKEESFLSRNMPLLAGLGAGLGAYKYMRTPGSNKYPGLTRIQRRANDKGYYRVVPVSTRKNVDLYEEENLFDKIKNFTVPVAEKDLSMSRLNKALMWLHEGSGAIPVVGDKKGRMHVVGSPDGKFRVPKGAIVQGRQYWHPDAKVPMRKVVKGGIDLEGDLRSQRAATRLGEKGKAFEAQLLQKHAPKSIAKTETDLTKFAPAGPVPTDLPGRLAYLKQYQANIRKNFAKKYMVKTTLGSNSQGAFPTHEGSWGKEYKRFHRILADPKKAKKLQKLMSASDQDPLGDFLHERDAYEGYVMDKFLRDPSTALVQKQIPRAKEEWRIHTARGQVMPWMASPRHMSSPDDLTQMGTGGPPGMHDWVQKQLARLPRKYRNGAYGMDVMRYKKKDGTDGFKFVELNSSERAEYNTKKNPNRTGAGSSMWKPDHVFSGPMLHQDVTGRATEPLALAAAIPAAGAATGIARLLRPKEEEGEGNPSPTSTAGRR